MARTNIPDIKIVYDNMDELFSVPQVAEKLGSSQGFVRKMIHLGLLPAIYFGRYPRVRKFTLNAFLERFEGQDLVEVADAIEREKEYGRKR
jgi:excisionase family DNA binding protein